MNFLKKFLLVVIGIPIFVIIFILFTAFFSMSGIILIAFVVGVIACLITGIASIVLGIASVFGTPSLGLAAMSTGFLVITLSIIFIVACLLLIKKVIPFITNRCLSILSGIKSVFFVKRNLAEI